MNLTNSSEPMGQPHYKHDGHDMMPPGPYYQVRFLLLFYRVHTNMLFCSQNASTDMQQGDGLLSSILNEEDFQLMDMAMNEGECFLF